MSSGAWSGVVILLESVFAASVAQILLKISANRSYHKKIEEYLNPFVIGGYVILLATTFINVYALKRIPLSLASALDASGQIFIPILSFLVLKEKISCRKLFGMIVIMIGMLLFFS